MKRTIKATLYTLLLTQAINALKICSEDDSCDCAQDNQDENTEVVDEEAISEEDENSEILDEEEVDEVEDEETEVKEVDVCSEMTHSGPINYVPPNTVIENTIITANPDTDVAITISTPNVTLRNVIIYHPSNGKGIYGWEADNLTIENVEVIAYGNEWGAQPCPTRAPLNGYRCSNMEIRKSEGLTITNVRVEGGSKGVNVIDSPGAILTGIVARNMRGPFPAGQCVQVARSDDTVLSNFHCLNDPFVSWTEDSISIWRSSNVVVKDGVVDGNNANTGICVMFEGSQEGVGNGRIENVEAIHCQGCFSAFPMEGLFQTGNTCASSICPNHVPLPRGGKKMVNMWAAGDNQVHGLSSSNIQVENSFYFDACEEDVGRIKWEKQEGHFTTFEVSELESFEPRTPPTVSFAWDSCGYSAPDIDCSEFKVEDLGLGWTPIDVNGKAKDDALVYQGSCFGWTNWLY